MQLMSLLQRLNSLLSDVRLTKLLVSPTSIAQLLLLILYMLPRESLTHYCTHIKSILPLFLKNSETSLRKTTTIPLNSRIVPVSKIGHCIPQWTKTQECSTSPLSFSTNCPGIFTKSVIVISSLHNGRCSSRCQI